MDKNILTLLGKLQLTETNPDLRWRIVQMIANASGEKGNEILISNLGHFDTGVSLASLKVLRERKPPEAVPGLIKYLNRSDVKERWIAVDILKDIRTEEAVSAIEKCAVNPGMEKKARLRAITALGKLKAKTSRQAQDS
ncbi:MAG: HEAT repeat domain-containing protein [Planctomycetota bacterium]|nr:MAG: HEAT repeat domain-containing protein [Planctomycetota bacterium]